MYVYLLDCLQVMFRSVLWIVAMVYTRSDKNYIFLLSAPSSSNGTFNRTRTRQGLTAPPPTSSRVLTSRNTTPLPNKPLKSQSVSGSGIENSFLGNGYRRILILTGFGILLLLIFLLVCLLICLIVRRRKKDQDAYAAVETAENQADVSDNGLPQGNYDIRLKNYLMQPNLHLCN